MYAYNSSGHNLAFICLLFSSVFSIFLLLNHKLHTQTDPKQLSSIGHIQQQHSTSVWPRRSAYIQRQHQVRRSIKWEIAVLESEVY